MKKVVIFNPSSGRHRGLVRLREKIEQRKDSFELRPTSASGEAEQLAYAACQEGYAEIYAAGGDGTVHEVANGILRSERRDVVLGIIPIGSANDYYFSLKKQMKKVPGQSPLALDVGRVSEPNGRKRYFVCCLGLGFGGAVTLESRRIEHLQGVLLYSLAAVQALRRHFRAPVMHISEDDAAPVAKRTLMFSVLVGNREGGFVMAHDADMTDGIFDLMHVGPLSRWQIFRLLPRLALFGAPRNYPEIEFGRCKKISLVSEDDLIVHVDGEFFCVLEDRVRELTIESLPGRLKARLLTSRGDIKTPTLRARPPRR